MLMNFIISRYREFSKDSKRIVANFFSLSILEGVNYLLPLITLPYLVRVLGPAKFGVIAFAQAFITYFVIVTDYGFYLSAPKNIAIHRASKTKVSQIFSSIMIIKSVFMGVSLLVFMTLVFTIARFRLDKFIYIFAFGNVLGDVLFPTWFFQGMERMKYITWLYFIAKLIFLVAIFVFIRSSTDYLYVPLFNSLGLIIAGIVSLWIIFRQFGVRFRIPPRSLILSEIREGWHFFVSTLSINLYTYSGTFILGLFAPEVFVGYYSAAEKLIRAVQRMLWAASRSVYPYINKLATESKGKAMAFLRKILLIFGSSFLLISLIIFIGAHFIVRIVLGTQYEESIVVLKILAFLPFIISMGNIFGIQTMLAFDLKRAFSNIMLVTAFLNIGVALVLVPVYKHIGISIAVLLTELFVTMLTFLYVRRKGIRFWEVPISTR